MLITENIYKMKKHLLALLALAGVSLNSQAATGDTTWVNANMDTLSWYGNYDSTVTFPTGGTYRNIYMIVTVGKYVCPGSPTYCGDWDYTFLTYLMTPGGDTLELGRLITPYANSGAPRTPATWTQRYVYDVTDYAEKLQGPGTMRILYSGYSGGFTGNIKFAFIEGTPDRNVKGISRPWHGSYSYGGGTNINTKFPAVTETAPSGTQSAALKFLITGHGSDNSGCCEFMSTNYHVLVNSSPVATKAVWRDNCGENELYPQSGTWLYDRANWCPGAIVNSNWHSLPGIGSSSTYNLRLYFDPYTSSGGGLGSYTTEAHVIYYGEYNKLVDAGIEDIVSPTNNENHFRANPTCGSPMITVKNRGRNQITLMTIEYGIKDSAMQSYTWSGILNAQETQEIALPDLINLQGLAGNTTTSTFVAKIKTVNGSTDADTTNDVMTSEFMPSPKWDGQFKVVFRPNNQTASSGKSETYWKIYDADNNVVRERVDATINTTYTDTVVLPTGCYRLELTDEGCDGLSWWVYNQNPGMGVNAGSFFVRKLTNITNNIPMNGYVYSGTFAHDFGCKFTQYFYTSTPTGVTDIAASNTGIEAYPNPANGVVNVDLSGMTNVAGQIHIIDALGRIVKSQPCNSTHTEISLQGMSTGVYTILFTDINGKKLQQRLVVQQ